MAADVPTFDVAKSCRAGQGIATGQNPFAACMQTEEKARDELKAQWARFPQAAKTECIQLCNCGGVTGSYVELLTCLQMRSNSEKILPTAPK